MVLEEKVTLIDRTDIAEGGFFLKGGVKGEIVQASFGHIYIYPSLDFTLYCNVYSLALLLNLLSFLTQHSLFFTGAPHDAT